MKWLSERRGFGFKDGGEAFLHHSVINTTGFKSLDEGDRVGFEVGLGKRGPAAKSVTKL